MTAAVTPGRAQAPAAPPSDPPADYSVALPAFPVIEAPLAAVPVADDFATTATALEPPQLQELEPLDFASALRRLPGVTITRFNQVGAFGGGEGGAVFLRGLGASRPGGEIKLLLDGVPKLNGVFNHPLLDLVSVDSADRIEIHARATPLEHGNVFGAVNVVTPRLDAPGRRLRVDLAAGSFGTIVQRLDAAARNARADVYFTQSIRQSDGHRPDSDGRLENQLLRLGWRLAPRWEAAYTVNHTRNRATDPGPAGVTAGPLATRGEIFRTHDWLHIATITHTAGLTRGTLRAYLNDGDADWLRRDFSGGADSLSSWRLSGVRWRQTLHPRPGTAIVGGADFDVVRGSLRLVPPAPGVAAEFPARAMRLLAAYAGITHTVALPGGARLTPSAGARHYGHSEFERRWAPQAGVTFASGDTRLHVGASRAVSYPGLEVAVFSQTLIPALGQSWRALRPEQADQFEAGIRHAFDARTAAALTVFSNRARDRYVIVFPPPPPPRYANLETFRTEGLEFSADAAPRPDFGVFVAATLMRARPGDIPYAPTHSYTGGFNWRPAPAWRLSVDGAYVSSMHTASAARVAGAPNPLIAGAHFLLNARLTRRFALPAHERLGGEIYLAAENLTDREFAYQPGYPIPGVNFMLGLRMRR